jgi:hypothetical protein
VYQTLADNTELLLTNQLKDGSWYLAEYKSKPVWVHNTAVKSEISNCHLPDSDLVELLPGKIDTPVVIYDDTFQTAFNSWATDGNLIEIRENNGDSVLHVDAQELTVIKAQRQPTGQQPGAGVFELFSSFEHAEHGSNGYVGIRFNTFSEKSFDVRIFGDCRVEVYTNASSTPFARDTTTQCATPFGDYLQIEYSAGSLKIVLNEVEVNPIALPSDLHDGIGNVQLLANETEVDFSYLLALMYE